MTEPRVIVCAGTGGVGKTTIAAALGVKLALKGHRTLVLTIDPARRLAQALGLQGPMTQDVPVADPKLQGKLFATMLDPQSVFDRFVRRAAPDPAVAEKLFKNRLYQQLVTSLSGSQEFTSLERVLSSLETGAYDVLILDTPPCQNAIEFLRAPERIFSLFQDSVTKWFRRDQEEPGLLASLFSRGTRTVVSALERITGSQFIGELTDFFQQMAHLQGRVRERSQEVHRLLTSASTEFVLVTGFDEVKLRDAMEFQEDLKNSGYHLSGLIINRCFPDWNFSDDGWDREPNWKLAALHEYYLMMRRQFERRAQMADQLEAKISGTPVLRIPEMKSSPQGLEELIKLSDKLGDGHFPMGESK